MPVYSYRCRECGLVRDSQLRDDIQPCVCGGLSRRDYSSVQFGLSAFKPHYNYSVGQHVNNRRDFEDALKHKADDNTEQTGVWHDYSPVDPSELKTMIPSTDTAIIEDQARAMKDKGLDCASS